MDRQGVSVTDLARLIGVSRQTLHRILQSDFRPLPRTVADVGLALGLDAHQMLKPGVETSPDAGLKTLLDKAVGGDPRAFELLPAHLRNDPTAGRRVASESESTEHLLLAAAAAIANTLRPSRGMTAAISYHSRKIASGTAFFFQSRFMPPELAMQKTPKPMREHRVFGAFDLDDFRRHMP
jgi:transcriptional regulator with XRE-family HTH domain